MIDPRHALTVFALNDLVNEASHNLDVLAFVLLGVGVFGIIGFAFCAGVHRHKMQHKLSIASLIAGVVALPLSLVAIAMYSHNINTHVSPIVNEWAKDRYGVDISVSRSLIQGLQCSDKCETKHKTIDDTAGKRYVVTRHDNATITIDDAQTMNELPTISHK